jgi:hypothetical protein
MITSPTDGSVRALAVAVFDCALAAVVDLELGDEERPSLEHAETAQAMRTPMTIAEIFGSETLPRALISGP